MASGITCWEWRNKSNLEKEGIQVAVVRKPIRRMHLRVYPDGRVVVTTPWLMPNSMIQAFVEQQWPWVKKTRERLEHQPPKKPLPSVSREQAKELIDYLTREVERWRILMGEEPVTWTIRNMKTQWGNCRPKIRKLTFNLQLALVENELRDYIIVHELSHLKVPNHGPEFKAREAEFLPDFRDRQRRLKGYLQK